MKTVFFSFSFLCLILSQQWDCLFSVSLSAWLLLSSSSLIMESSELCKLLILIFLILRRRITTPSPTWARCSSTRSLILLSLLVIWFLVWTFWFLLHFLGYMWDKKPGFYERYWKKITDVFLSHKVYYALVLGNHDNEVIFPLLYFPSSRLILLARRSWSWIPRTLLVSPRSALRVFLVVLTYFEISFSHP